MDLRRINDPRNREFWLYFGPETHHAHVHANAQHTLDDGRSILLPYCKTIQIPQGVAQYEDTLGLLSGICAESLQHVADNLRIQNRQEYLRLMRAGGYLSPSCPDVAELPLLLQPLHTTPADSCQACVDAIMQAGMSHVKDAIIGSCMRQLYALAVSY